MTRRTSPLVSKSAQRHWRWKLLPALFGLATLLPATGLAQATGSPSSRSVQFVFVIDDSGSMRGHGGEAAADPDRLAVFSVQALLSMLDPRDEATVVRLNGPRDGEDPPPLRPLQENRSSLADQLRLDGDLASYEGSYTPCRSALEETKQLLQRAYRPNVSQVVMFLTDGRCTPQNEIPRAEEFLQGLDSQAEGLLRFYLLRFEGRSFSNELVEMAQATGGQVIEVAGDDPTGILEPFADALTRSQGYEAELLTPTARELAAHRGARRVRLLAVAPGDGPRLDFRIADSQGHSPSLLGQTRHGIHKYPQGRIYRFAALDYRPSSSPMTVEVANAGEHWKVVAVPEYRLSVQVEVRRGTCDDPGPPLRHATDAGSPVCVRLALIDEQGRPVERGGLGQIEAFVLYGRSAERLEKLPATPEGDTAVYTFERRRLEPGNHVFRPVVELELPGRKERILLSAAPVGMEASTLRIQPRPASLDFGTLRPGEESAPQPIVFDGNFAPAPGRLEVTDRRSLPSCITFTLSGKPEGASQEVRPGTRMTLVARAAPYCGPQDVQRDFAPILRVVFDSGESGDFLPASEIGATVSLDYHIEHPAELVFALRAGEDSDLPLRLLGNQVAPFDLEVVVEPPAERTDWPENHLSLGFGRGDDRLVPGEDGPATEARATFDPASSVAPLHLRLRSAACCAEGSYETAVAFLPAADAAYADPPPPALVVPVRIEVQGVGFWACRGNALLWGLLLLLLAVLVLYTASMLRNSSFLDRDRLAEALTPLRWDAYGGTQRDSRSSGEVRAMVRRGLPVPDRALAWLKANPLIFGLPGRSYRETVELSLQPQNSIDRSSLHLIPHRDLQRALENEPEQGAGRLFAQAIGRRNFEFFGVPLRGRLGRLVPERLQEQHSWSAGSPDQEAASLRLLRLRRREQLLHPLPSEERIEGHAAGWQVG